LPRPKKKKTEIPIFPHQDHVDEFFDPQGLVYTELIPEGIAVNAEFYKEVMNRQMKRIQQVGPAAFCSLNAFLLHDNVPAHTAASFYQFLTPPPKKMLQPFITPRTLQIYLRHTFFFSPG